MPDVGSRSTAISPQSRQVKRGYHSMISPPSVCSRCSHIAQSSFSGARAGLLNNGPIACRRACMAAGLIQSTVHPHGCGELNGHEFTADGPDGSSPRVWGVDKLLLFISRHTRFIPTGVGSCPQFHSAEKHMSVHPHGCGELAVPVSAVVRIAGSSPRVWGVVTH